ncbi:DUF1366 domain-containing protein, partial [Streptococcus suis]|nr:DUF1366 domain-containing protein [Streptococcus suis]
MKFKFLTKSTEWLGSSPHRTIVVVGNEEGATIPYAFDKEAINLTDSELFDMAMEKMYQENFPNRAEDEKFEFFNKAILEVRKETEKNREIAKTMSLSFTQFVELLEERGIVLDDEETEEVADHETIIEN